MSSGRVCALKPTVVERFPDRSPKVIDYGGNIPIVHSNGKTEYITAEQAKYVIAINDGAKSRYLYVPTLLGAMYHADDTPNLLLEGSRNTGKSVLARFDFHLRALRTPGFSYVIIRRTYKELQKTHIRYIEAEMKDLGGTYNRSDKICRYPNGSIGFFSHVETEQDVLNLLGGDFHAILFDEGTTIDFEWQQKLASSVRVGLALVRITTNPLGASVDDIWKYYVDRDVPAEEDEEYEPDDYGHVHTVMADNPYADVERYKKRFAGLPEHVKRAWLDGERIVADQLFDFRRLKDGRQWHEILELPRMKGGASIFKQEWVKFYRAYDAGYYPDPAYCLWIAVIGRRIIPFKEKLWLRKSAEEIARDILAETDHLGITVTATFADPSIDLKQSDIVTVRDRMERAGLPLDLAVNNRELFAAVIHSALKEEILESGVDETELRYPKLSILQAGFGAGPGLGCPYLIKSLPSMKYDEKKPMAMAPHKHDHPVVALAYFLMSWGVNTVSAEEIPVVTPRWMKPLRAARAVLGSRQVRRPR